MADPYRGTPYEGLDPLFAARIKAMVDASGGRLSITSGYRSYERQKQLWNNALRKYGSAAAARKWVANPDNGKGSNHMHGLAVDLGFSGDEARRWAHANAARFGLFFPMDHEPWHIEPIRTSLGDDFNVDAYTDPPIGAPPVADPHDPMVQMTRVLAMMDQDLMAAMQPGDPIGEPGVPSILGAGRGQVDLDEGASMRDFGFADEPRDMAERMEERFDGDH